MGHGRYFCWLLILLIVLCKVAAERTYIKLCLRSDLIFRFRIFGFTQTHCCDKLKKKKRKKSRTVSSPKINIFSTERAWFASCPFFWSKLLSDENAPLAVKVQWNFKSNKSIISLSWNSVWLHLIYLEKWKVNIDICLIHNLCTYLLTTSV